MHTGIVNLICTHNELLNVLANYLSIFKDVKYKRQKHET